MYASRAVLQDKLTCNDVSQALGKGCEIKNVITNKTMIYLYKYKQRHTCDSEREKHVPACRSVQLISLFHG